MTNESTSLLMPPYAGLVQNQVIGPQNQPPEDGPWVMPPYANMFVQSGVDIVPPPLSKTDIWSAQQTYPL